MLGDGSVLHHKPDGRHNDISLFLGAGAVLTMHLDSTS
jgi:hypothetical protein